MDRARSPQGLPRKLSGAVLRPRLVTRAHNLPVELSSFVGREHQIAQVGELLLSARLVTLSGPGGIGKTRLALAVAEAVLNDCPDGVWLVELASLADPALVDAATARVFGVQSEAGTPLINRLADHLRARSLLLVLDNCEHLVDACAELASSLLRVCPAVRVLATSRQPLGVSGEQVWPVPALAVPDADGPKSVEGVRLVDAIRLFVERSRATRPGFALTEQNVDAVVSLCRQLDGLPLAIELAAAQVRGLAPDQLLDRLDDGFRRLTGVNRDAPLRQQTLLATIEWSYGLLTEPERVLFRRLGVFAGGWTVEAAEAVTAGDGLDRDDVLGNLMRLIDKSLVMTDAGTGGRVRYRLLVTLRHDAVERLLHHAEAERTRDRHAATFLALAKRAECALTQPDEAAWLAALETENDNLRTALTWSIDRGDVDSAWAMGAALWRFWLHRGYLLEGAVWLSKLLSLPGDRRSRARMRLLHGAARLNTAMGDLATAHGHAHLALELARDFGDYSAISVLVNVLGGLARSRGDFAAARALHEEGIQASRELTQQSDRTQTYPPRLAGWFELENIWSLGLAATEQGDCVAGLACGEEARARATEDGYPRVLAAALRVLGLARYRQGDYPAARAFLRQSLEVWTALGERGHGETDALIDLGCAAREQGELTLARQTLGEALEILHTNGGRLRTARCLDAFAGLAAACGQPERSLQLAETADELYRAMGCDPAHVYRHELERWTKVARDALGATRPPEAPAVARSLTRYEAIAEALAIATQVDRPLHGSVSLGANGISSPLTPREREVSALIAHGLSNREIAAQLVIAHRTVAHHVENILDKLDLGSRVQVAAWAVQHGVPGAREEPPTRTRQNG